MSTVTSSYRSLVTLAAVVILVLAGCAQSSPPTVLHVLASADLANLAPVLDALQADTGIKLQLDTSGPVDASIGLEPGHYDHDLAWLSTDSLFQLKVAASGGVSPQSTRTMLSPLVVGVTPALGDRLREGGSAVSWSSIADGAARGEVRFALGDPHRTAAGLEALVGVATAAAGTGRALRPEDVTCDRLRGFLAGRALTAGPMSVLVDQFVDHQPQVNALIANESEILALNDSGRLRVPLQIVYPADGVVQAEYPLLLLDPAKQSAYDRIVAWLRSPAAQRRIMEVTARRPILPDVPRPARLAVSTGNSLYFPDDLAVVQALLAHYDSAIASPSAHVVFLLDFSSSMQGTRIEALRRAFDVLTGAGGATFARIYQGERVTVARFGGQVMDVRDFSTSDPAALADLRTFVASPPDYQATGIGNALEWSYAAAAADAGHPVSVVLMTDGLGNTGPTPDEVLAAHRGMPLPRTDTIGTGVADPAELARVAVSTGGRTDDATDQGLADALKDLHGCQ